MCACEWWKWRGGGGVTGERAEDTLFLELIFLDSGKITPWKDFNRYTITCHLAFLFSTCYLLERLGFKTSCVFLREWFFWNTFFHLISFLFSDFEVILPIACSFFFLMGLDEHSPPQEEKRMHFGICSIHFYINNILIAWLSLKYSYFINYV